MLTFLWCMFFVTIAELLGRLIWLAKGEFPRRTAAQEAANAAVGIALLVWLVLLLKEAL